MSGGAPEAGIGMPMLFEFLVPALAGIASGLVVGFLTAYFQAKSFRRDWTRAREDMIAAQAIGLIHEMATDLVRVAHAMWWLTWRTEHAPDTVGEKQINDFEMEIRNLLPKIHGAHAALRASHPEAAEKMAGVVDRLDQLDMEFAHSCIAFRADKPEALKKSLSDSEAFKRALPGLIKGCAKWVAQSRGGPDGRNENGPAND